MIQRRKLIWTFLSIATGAAVPLRAGDEKPYRAKPAQDYPSKQTIGGLTLAAVKFESDGEAALAFGKLNPNEYGILPVMLVLDNQGDTLLLNAMEVTLQGPNKFLVEPTPPDDIPFLMGVKRPNLGPKVPIPIPLPKKKNPLGAVELQTRAWGAKTMLKGEQAQGFFYFQTRYRRESFLYVRRIRDAKTGKEIFFAEIPLDPPEA